MNSTPSSSKASNSFDKVASLYHDHAECQRLVAEHLCKRLEDCAVTPDCVLDLGAGTGFLAEYARQQFPKAEWVALDRSFQMLSKHIEGVSAVQGDMDALPFRPNCFDLIISSMAMHWSKSWADVLVALKGLLKPGGVLLFAMPGPDTFIEWQIAWEAVDAHAHVLHFPDPAAVAQQLWALGFAEPVVDRETWLMSYPSFEAVHQSMKQTGVQLPGGSRQGLLGRNAYQLLRAAYAKQCPSPEDWTLRFDVTMAYARCPVVTSKAEQVAYLSPDAIKRPE